VLPEALRLTEATIQQQHIQHARGMQAVTAAVNLIFPKGKDEGEGDGFIQLSVYSSRADPPLGQDLAPGSRLPGGVASASSSLISLRFFINRLACASSI